MERCATSTPATGPVDAGSVTAMVVVLVVSFVAVAGLVLDGSRLVAARATAADAALGAARAGAQQLVGLRAGDARVDPVAAVAAADAWLAARGEDGDVSADATEVTVVVRGTCTPVLLGWFGVRPRHFAVVRSAVPVESVSGP